MTSPDTEIEGSGRLGREWDGEQTPAAVAPGRRAGPGVVALAACAAVAALSLLLAAQSTYDPTAWLIWGREIAHGTLNTVAGPSWKPLPVAVTVPASLLGEDAAQDIWLAVARTGGLLALWFAFRVARRLTDGSLVAGCVAVAGLVLARDVYGLVFRGNSEGLLVALVLGGVDRLLAGRRGQALIFATAAALLRPEAWAVLGLYGLWLLWTDRERRRHWLGWLALAGLLVLAAWFVPEKIGSGDFLRGASRAREAVPHSPGASSHPFLATFTNGARALAYPVYFGAVVATVWGLLRRRRATLLVAGLSALWMLLVAALAQRGFTGSLRYVTMPAALLCVLGGVGWAVLAAALARRWLAVLVVLAVPGVVLEGVQLHRAVDDAARESRLFAALPGVIEQAGGRAAVVGCGPVFTGAFQTQALAWRLHTHEHDIGIRPAPPGTVLAPAGLGMTRDGRFPLRLRTREWVLRSTCPLSQRR
jgi:hypothetical protein